VLAARVGQEQIDQHNTNSKAHSVLFLSLSLSEFEQISDCTTTARDLDEASELSRENHTGQK
jgi:hypothetical protein